MSCVSVVGGDAIYHARLLIADQPGGEPDRQLFTDDELALLIAAEGSTLAGAAAALDAIAVSEVLLSKKITTQDLSTDGPAVAAELRKQADSLRARAAEAAAGAWGVATVGTARPWPPEGTEWARL